MIKIKLLLLFDMLLNGWVFLLIKINTCIHTAPYNEKFLPTTLISKTFHVFKINKINFMKLSCKIQR
jgi:hypothetical protein